MISLLALTMLCSLLPANAHADNCESIAENPNWLKGLQSLIQTMQNNDMQSAKLQAKALAEICPNAPTLNYLQGKISEALDEKTDALYFYQKASENTYHFAVDPDTAKKIWYARYENEHPERTKIALEERSKELSSTSDKIVRLEADNAKLIEALNTQNSHQEQSIKNLMWAGTGLGIGGLVLLGPGSALMFVDNQNEVKDSITGSTTPQNAINNKSIGLPLVGVGAALTLTGAILAGIYGYKYTHFHKNSEYTLQISPVSLSLSYTF